MMTNEMTDSKVFKSTDNNADETSNMCLMQCCKAEQAN